MEMVTADASHVVIRVNRKEGFDLLQATAIALSFAVQLGKASRLKPTASLTTTLGYV